MLKILRGLLVCFCISVPAQAQFSKHETAYLEQSLDFLRITPAHSDYWEDYVMLQGPTYEMLIRVAQRTCGYSFDSDVSRFRPPALRRAIDEAIAFNKPLRAAGYSYLRDLALKSAQSRFKGREWAQFERFMADTEMLKLDASLDVLGDFPSLPLDPLTGQIDSFPLLWLKTYFEKEGLSGQLKQALGKVDPKMPALFDKLKSMESHTAADDENMNALWRLFAPNAEKVYETYYNLHDPRLLERVEAFGKHPIHPHIRRVKFGYWVNTRPDLRKFVPEIQAKPKASWTKNEALVVEASVLVDAFMREYPMPPALATELGAPKTYEALIGPQAASSVCAILKAAKHQ